MKKLFGILAIGLLSLGTTFSQAAKIDKKAAKAAEVKTAITSNSYVFKANYVIPMTLNAGPLNSNNYDVTVNDGKLEVYLPYFGRAYTTPRNPNEGGIKLKTSDYDYTSVANKKGGWDITIKPKKTTIQTVDDVQLMKLTVGKDGYATMYITSINRQPITFNGYIEQFKQQ
jgi:hypothetical protein